MREFELKNGIKAIYKQNKNTPRVAVCLNFAINDQEKLAGVYSLLARLFLQGTTNRTSEQLAIELDENAIELSCNMKQDYFRFRFVCLNEDFEKAVEIMEDVIKNPSFIEFEKEKEKMNGEITAELDSARTKALDNFYKNIFANHFYGNTYSRILEDIDKITKEDIIDAYNMIIKEGRKILSFVGDLEFSNTKNILDKALGNLSNNEVKEKVFSAPILNEAKRSDVIKEDIQQAQILKGWLVPTYYDRDYPALVLLNVILGASGLSSRLFVNLRDKKGLAYVVRSAYETYTTCACFSFYIATEPKNIQTSLDGFIDEVQKLKDEPVSEKELENAKNNLFGKQQFIMETNYQQANILAYYGTVGLGFDFQDRVVELCKAVTPEEVQQCAQKYLNDINAISVLKP